MIVGTLWLIFLNTGIFSIGIIFWNRLWIRRFGIQIPGISEKFSSVGQVISHFSPILWNFDESYWIEYTGVEGFIYLLFQRYMISLLFIFTIISLFAAIPATFTNTTEEFTFMSTSSPTNMSSYTTWFQVGMVYLFSSAVFMMVFMLKKRVGTMLQEKAKERSHEKDHEWLKLRTVHVRGLDISDRSGEALATQMNSFLKDRGGRVVEVVLFPDFQKLIKLEIDREKTILMKNLFESDFPPPPVRCLPRAALNHEHYLLELDDIEKEIQEATMTPYWNSGHAVVSFNSLESVEKVLYHYRPSLRKTILLGLSNIIEKWKGLQRLRAFSATFERFPDDKDAAHKDIVVTRAVDPYDLIWVNVGGTRGFYFFRRVGVLFLAVLVLLFLSTPAALLAELKSVIGGDSQWFDNLPEPVANLFQAYFPSLFIIMLNQVLLILIDISAYMERHYCHTDVQSSILNVSVVYLSLNMLIIPGVTLAATKSLVKVLQDRDYLLSDILGELHLADSGAFFINVLLQKATYSCMFYLLRGPEIGMNYFSIWLGYQTRKDLNEHDKWRRDEAQVFQYGYFYALMLTSFGIVMTFCSSVPLVIPAGLFFFLLKHFVDSLNLLCVHGKEIHGEGRLLRSVINYASIFVLFYQVSMIGFFALNELRIHSFLVFALLMGSILVALMLGGRLYDIEQDDDEYYASIREDNEDTKHQWRKLYAHPLAISHI